MKTKRTVFFTMVRHPESGWIRVGDVKVGRYDADSWLPFVRRAWRGCLVKVSQCTLRFDDGVLSEKSAKIISEKFNMDASAMTAKHGRDARATEGGES